MEILNRRKEKGGWGILQLKCISWALLMKTILRNLNGNVSGITSSNLNTYKINRLYCGKRLAHTSHTTYPTFWRSFINIFPWIMRNIQWKFGKEKTFKLAQIEVVDLQVFTPFYQNFYRKSIILAFTILVRYYTRRIFQSLLDHDLRNWIILGP